MKEEFAAYQIIVFIIALLMIGKVLFQAVKRNKSIRELILACIIWGGFAILGMVPEVSQFIADVFGFEVGINALVVFSIFIIFWCLILLSAKIDKVHSNLTKFVRAEALNNLNKDKHEK